MTSAAQNLLDKLPEPLRRDPKKTLVLTGLMAAFGIVLYVQFFRGHGGEASAAASAPAAAPPSLAPGVPYVASPPPKGDAQSFRVQRWLESPPSPIERNVFQIRLENYQSTAAPEAVTRITTVHDGTFWDELEKSLAARADQNKQRQVWVDNIVAAASGLSLKTTIMGQSPSAMVSGQRVSVGDVLERPLPGTRTMIAFRVVAIEPRQLVIEHNGLRLAVPMAGQVNPSPQE